MTVDEILDYCLSKNGAYIDLPFGPVPVCVKVSKRIFLQIYPKPEDMKVTLNCDRLTGELYRSAYPETVKRGYHCPPVMQPYFNTVLLNGEVGDEEMRTMIDHAYSVVVGKLTKKLQAELREHIVKDNSEKNTSEENKSINNDGGIG